MRAIVLFILLLSVFDLGENYRILGIFPLPSSSHMVMFEKLMLGLAKKGHEVDVVSHLPQKKPVPRYNDLSLVGTIPLFKNFSIPFAQENMGNLYDTVKFITVVAGIEPCKALLSSTVAQELKNTNKKYDLLITELFGCDCALGFAHHFKIPVISMTSSVSLPWGGDRIGNPDNPSYIPNYLLPYLSRMSLTERIINTVTMLAAKVMYMMSVKNVNLVAREFFGPDLPDLRDLAYNTSLIFVNSHFSINQARPTVPNLIEVGGIHIGPQKALPKHLEDALNVTGQYKGVIYLSMGSMIATESLPIEKLNAFFETFRKLPYKVLWKATRTNIPKELDIPSNIQFEPWLPQLDILCHPNIKLFVTHGGLMGTQEGIFCGVPRLGIPIFADQELNMKTSEAMGLAIMINYDNITKESISGAVKALLEDARYKENAETVSKLFRDRPHSALDTAIYWVEYVIRHKGAPHLRTVGADLPWYQYFLVDVGAILLTFLVTIVALIYFSLLYVLRMLGFGKEPSNKPKKE